MVQTAGCDLFSLRDPEPPVGSSGGWIFPQSPQLVLDNLESAVGRRSNVDYMKSFASPDNGLPELQFLADPATAADFPGKFTDWGLEKEGAFVQSLFSASNLPLDSLAVLEITAVQMPVLGDSAYVAADYDLRLGHLRDTAPRRMVGRLEFRLLRGADGGWFIQRWTDYRVGGEPCWSDLKAQF